MNRLHPRGGAVALAGCLLVAGACAQSSTADARSARSPRVVSLHDVTSEILVELAAVDHVVGRGGHVDVAAAARVALAAVSEVGDVESILATRPDLVVGLDVVAEQSPDLVRALRERGVEVVLYDPVDADSVVAMIRDLAGRVGAYERGRAVAGEVATALIAPRADVANPVRVFVYDCCDPPFTAGGRTVLTDLIARAGGRNVFDDVAADWAHVSWEQAVARRPELIVVVVYDMDGQRGARGKRGRLARMPGLAQVPVVEIPLHDVLGGLGSVQGLARLRAAVQAVAHE